MHASQRYTIVVFYDEWESILHGIVRPLPKAAVLADLRWWCIAESSVVLRDGKRLSRPGRLTLAARWGWSQRQVRKIVKAFDNCSEG